MRSTLRTRGESLFSLAALLALLGGIIASDIRLRDQMSRRLDGVAFDLAGTGAQVHSTAATLAATAQAHSIEYAPLWTFVAVATVLTIWMVRS